MRMRARDIAQMDIHDVWALSTGPKDFRVELEFDDGVLETWMRPTIFSAHVWRIHREWPNTPLLMRHHMGNGHLTDATHKDLLSYAIFDCYDAHQHIPEFKLIDVCKVGYEIFNLLYNNLISKLDAYVTSISILDFMDVIFHPEVQRANDAVIVAPVVTNAALQNARDKVIDLIHNSPDLRGNALQHAARTKLVNRDQLAQCTANIGYRTDADSYAFKNPVRVSFAHGLYIMEDYLKESRSATKSAHFNKNHVADSEYTNRIIQFSASCLSKVHAGDCGSKVFSLYQIKDEKTLRTMHGIFRRDETTGGIKPITSADRALVGHTVEIRTVFGCQHPDRYGVCMTCLGEIGISIDPKANLGHLAATRVQGPLAQLILSTKHLDGNTKPENIDLDPVAELYLRELDMGEIGISSALAGKRYKMTILATDAPFLHDLHHVTDVYELTPSRLTSLGSMIMTVTTETGEHVDSFPLGSMSTRPYFSHPMLDHIKRHGWLLEESGHIVVDLTEWDTNETAFILPLKQFSTPDYAAGIEKFLKSPKTKSSKKVALMNVPKLTDFKDPIVALATFHDMVNEKLAVNLSHLQVVILSTMAESPETFDYGTPIHRMSGVAVEYSKLMEMRSMGALMAYEGQVNALYSPYSYTVTERPPHILDYCLEAPRYETGRVQPPRSLHKVR